MVVLVVVVGVSDIEELQRNVNSVNVNNICALKLFGLVYFLHFVLYLFIVCDVEFLGCRRAEYHDMKRNL